MGLVVTAGRSGLFEPRLLCVTALLCLTALRRFVTSSRRAMGGHLGPARAAAWQPPAAHWCHPGLTSNRAARPYLAAWGFWTRAVFHMSAHSCDVSPGLRFGRMLTSQGSPRCSSSSVQRAGARNRSMGCAASPPTGPGLPSATHWPRCAGRPRRGRRTGWSRCRWWQDRSRDRPDAPRSSPRSASRPAVSS